MQSKAGKKTKTHTVAEKTKKEVKQREGNLRGGSGVNGEKSQDAGRVGAGPAIRRVRGRQRSEDNSGSGTASTDGREIAAVTSTPRQSGSGTDIACGRVTAAVADAPEEMEVDPFPNGGLSAEVREEQARKSKDGWLVQTARRSPLWKGQG